MFSFPTRRLDLFYYFWPNVQRLFRRITRKGLLAALAKRRPTPFASPSNPLILKPYGFSDHGELGAEKSSELRHQYYMNLWNQGIAIIHVLRSNLRL